MIKYSEKLQKKIDELGLKAENILYLPIAQRHLARILSGEKVCEFREASDHYANKFMNFDPKSNEYISDKPLTHILFQGGYTKDSPRVLVELKGKSPKTSIFDHQAGKPFQSEERAKMAAADGYTVDDDFFAILLGSVVFEENIIGIFDKKHK